MSEIDRILAEQRAAAEYIVRNGVEPLTSQWLDDWIAEEVLLLRERGSESAA